MKDKKFNKSKYDQALKKELYTTFKVDLKNEEHKELIQLIGTERGAKANFLRNAIKELKSKKR